MVKKTTKKTAVKPAMSTGTKFACGGKKFACGGKMKKKGCCK